MRTVWYTLFGMVYGFVLGAALPFVLFALYSWLEPQGAREGLGTVFSMMLLVTPFLGIILGAQHGYRRANPTPGIETNNPRQWLDDFEQQFAEFPIDSQRQALVELLPGWIRRYRRQVLMTLVYCLAFGYIFRLSWLGVFVLTLFTGNLAIHILRMRRVVQDIRSRWGDEPLAAVEPLPYTLRGIRAEQHHW